MDRGDTAVQNRNPDPGSLKTIAPGDIRARVADRKLIGLLYREIGGEALHKRERGELLEIAGREAQGHRLDDLEVAVNIPSERLELGFFLGRDAVLGAHDHRTPARCLRELAVQKRIGFGGLCL
jgi:hypothetical protein